MDTNNISPFIRIALDSIIHPPWTLTERVLFDYELLYIKEGEVLITIEDRNYHGKPGDIYLFKPKQPHSIRVIGNSRFHQPHIHFDLFYRSDSPDVKISFRPLEQISDSEMNYFREDVTSEGSMQLPNKIVLNNVRYFEEMLFEIIEEYRKKKPFYEMNLKGLFIRLWTYILRKNYWNSNPVILSNLEELDKIRDYLDCHLHTEVSLDELSKEFKFSKYHLERLFKKAFAITPIHYHQMLRMEKAKEAIQFSNRSYTEIADTFGFKSLSAFSRAFKQKEGIPPSSYRNRILR